MKTLRFIFFLAILIIASRLYAQEGKNQVSQVISRDSLLAAARTIIDSSSCQIFITVDENGKPHAREMSPFPPEKDWVIWLGTSQSSRKVKQIQNNPNVIVYYYQPKGYSYVSLAGKARLVNDPDKKAKYWVDGWKRYYPDRDKNYILIEVTPENLELVSYKFNIFWDSKGAPQSVDFVAR
jgi:general stress protein 26